MSEDKKLSALSRLAAGENALQVAKDVGVSKPTIYAWKKEVVPAAPTSPTSVELESLRLERDYWKGLAELYRKECARLQAP